MRVLLFIGLCVWFGSAMAGLYYMADQRQVDFDPDLALLNQSLSVEYDMQLQRRFKREFGGIANTAFHLSRSDCFCTIVAGAHIQRVEESLSDIAFDNRQVKLDNPVQSSLNNLMPSSPAVVIFGDDEQLLYAGPYAQGAMCSSNQGFIEPLIGALQTGKPFGARIVSDAKGCYCKNG